jgi:hypothetical protein
MRTYIILHSTTGAQRVDPDAIVFISAPFVAKKNPESRQLGIAGTARIYILNTKENCEALGIPYEHMPEEKPKGKPGRKKKIVEDTDA